MHVHQIGDARYIQQRHIAGQNQYLTLEGFRKSGKSRLNRGTGSWGKTLFSHDGRRKMLSDITCHEVFLMTQNSHDIISR